MTRSRKTDQKKNREPRPGAVRRRRRTYEQGASYGAPKLSGSAGALGTSRVVASLLVVAMVCLLVWFFADFGFYVYGAEVRGASLTTAEQVYNSGSIDTMSIFYVNPTRTAERILRSLPAVAHAAVQCRWPNRVSIQIEERGARYAWETAGGQFLLDGQGRVVRLDDGSGEGLVLIRDLDREPVQIGDDVDQAPLRTAAQLRLLLPQVQSLEYSRDKGLSFVEEHGWRVFVGDDQDLQQKVATFRTVVQHLEARGASARFIDVRYEGCAHYE